MVFSCCLWGLMNGGRQLKALQDTWLQGVSTICGGVLMNDRAPLPTTSCALVGIVLYHRYACVAVLGVIAQQLARQAVLAASVSVTVCFCISFCFTQLMAFGHRRV